MLRRIKAIYLVPVFILLQAGAGFGLYFGVIAPQIQKTNLAQSTWTQAKGTCDGVEPTYQNSLDAQVKNSIALLDNYYSFHQIQDRMPNIVNMKAIYAGKEREGLIKWYEMMTSGSLIKELNRWAKGFGVKNIPDMKFSGMVPMDEMNLPDVKLLKMDFGEQTFTAHGFQDLLDQILRRTGYGYYPLIIHPAENKIAITVHRNDPSHRPNKPLLTMKYTCEGYCMTRGWDPNGYTSASPELSDAHQKIATPPTPTKRRDHFLTVAEGGNGDPPPILFLIKPDPKVIAP